MDIDRQWSDALGAAAAATAQTPPQARAQTQAQQPVQQQAPQDAFPPNLKIGCEEQSLSSGALSGPSPVAEWLDAGIGLVKQSHLRRTATVGFVGGALWKRIIDGQEQHAHAFEKPQQGSPVSSGSQKMRRLHSSTF